MAEITSEASVDAIKIEEFEGIGELTVGGASSNWHLIILALCLLNEPQVNKFMLANKLNLVDRTTKTKIFPRDGMALPKGEVYEVPPTLPDTEN